MGSLGGSFYSDDINDYYLTPHDLGYWAFVKFDHDFVGKEALEKMADDLGRHKVTLAWNGDDVAAAMRTQFDKADPVKYIDLPLSNYSTWPNDKVLLEDEQVGVSTFSGYSYNERSMLSLAVVSVDVEIGTEVTLVWGEEAARASRSSSATGRRRSARSSAVSVLEVARTTYAEGWRTGEAAVSQSPVKAARLRPPLKTAFCNAGQPWTLRAALEPIGWHIPIWAYDALMARAATTTDAFNAVAEPRRRQILDARGR